MLARRLRLAATLAAVALAATACGALTGQASGTTTVPTDVTYVPSGPLSTATQPDAQTSGSSSGTDDQSTTDTSTSDGGQGSVTDTAPTQTADTTADSTELQGSTTAVDVTDSDRESAANIVARLDVADKAASVVMVTGSDAIGTGLLTRDHVGGVILFAPGGTVDGTTTGIPAQVAAVTAALRDDAAQDPTGVPPLIATDQEYGVVQRLKNGFTTFPDAQHLGSIPDSATAADFTTQVAHAAAQEMLAVGVTVDFAPVFGPLPENGGPSAIGSRSYGTDPAKVALLVGAAVKGYQTGGVVASMKHFPGLARIAADSHVTLPTLDATCSDWNAREAVAAQAGVDAGTLMAMTAHLLFPAADSSGLPASISPTIVDGLLRGDGVAGCHGMNFTGVTVTDSMQMEPITSRLSSGDAAVAALRAGQDLLLMPADLHAAAAGIVAAVASGDLDEARLDEAATAVLALRIASARVERPPLDVVNSAEHRQLAQDALAAAR